MVSPAAAGDQSWDNNSRRLLTPRLSLSNISPAAHAGASCLLSSPLFCDSTRRGPAGRQLLDSYCLGNTLPTPARAPSVSTPRSLSLCFSAPLILSTFPFLLPSPHHPPPPSCCTSDVWLSCPPLCRPAAASSVLTCRIVLFCITFTLFIPLIRHPLILVLKITSSTSSISFT